MWDRTGYSVGAVVFSVLGCGAGLDDGSAETLGSQSSAVFTTTCEGNDHVCEIDSSNASDHASPTIQGSIAWYFAKRGSGYTYELNPGIFGIGDKITVPPNAILRAPSTESVEIRPKAGSKFFDPDVKVAMIQLSDGSSLEKIHADGDGASVIGPVNIVDATLTKAAVIRGCLLRESRGNAVTANLSAGLSIRHSIISFAGIQSNKATPTTDGTAHGINCFHCFDFEVKDTVVNYTRTAGIYMTGTLGAVIARNQIFNTSLNSRAPQALAEGWSAGDGITAYHNNSNPYQADYNIYDNDIWLFHNHGIHVSGDAIAIHDNYVDGGADQPGPFGHSAIWIGDNRPFPGAECSKHITVANNELYRGKAPDGGVYNQELGFKNYQRSSITEYGNTGWTWQPSGHEPYYAPGENCGLFHSPVPSAISPKLYYEFRYGVGVDTMNTRPAVTQWDARTVVNDRLGRVLRLDGDGDSLRIPNHSVFSQTGHFTVLALINPTELGQTRQIFSKDNSENGERSWQFRVTSDGRLELIVFATTTVLPPPLNSTNATVSSPANTIEAGKWSYVAGTYDGSRLRIYWAPLADLDKKHVKLAEVAEPVYLSGSLRSSSSDAYIGRAQTANAGYFLGSIDDVAFFDRALLMNHPTSDEDLEGVIQWGHMTMPDHELLHSLVP